MGGASIEFGGENSSRAISHGHNAQRGLAIAILAAVIGEKREGLTVGRRRWLGVSEMLVVDQKGGRFPARIDEPHIALGHPVGMAVQGSPQAADRDLRSSRGCDPFRFV